MSDIQSVITTIYDMVNRDRTPPSLMGGTYVDVEERTISISYNPSFVDKVLSLGTEDILNVYQIAPGTTYLAVLFTRPKLGGVWYDICDMKGITQYIDKAAGEVYHHVHEFSGRKGKSDDVSQLTESTLDYYSDSALMDALENMLPSTKPKCYGTAAQASKVANEINGMIPRENTQERLFIDYVIEHTAKPLGRATQIAKGITRFGDLYPDCLPSDHTASNDEIRLSVTEMLGDVNYIRYGPRLIDKLTNQVVESRVSLNCFKALPISKLVPITMQPDIIDMHLWLSVATYIDFKKYLTSKSGSKLDVFDTAMINRLIEFANEFTKRRNINTLPNMGYYEKEKHKFTGEVPFHHDDYRSFVMYKLGDTTFTNLLHKVKSSGNGYLYRFELKNDCTLYLLYNANDIAIHIRKDANLPFDLKGPAHYPIPIETYHHLDVFSKMGLEKYPFDH